MSQQVHDATGTECSVCGHKFTKSSLNLTITQSRGKHTLVKARVCGKCWNEHYSKGE